jgi:hypothetical protein
MPERHTSRLTQVLTEQVSVGCELMILFYAFDEYTDVENGAGARKIADIMIDALHHPEKLRPVGEIPLGELARQYVARRSALTLQPSPCLLTTPDFGSGLCPLHRPCPGGASSRPWRNTQMGASSELTIVQRTGFAPSTITGLYVG